MFLSVLISCLKKNPIFFSKLHFATIHTYEMSKKNDNCGSLSSKKPQNSRFMLSESFFILLISHTLSLFRKADARLGPPHVHRPSLYRRPYRPVLDFSSVACVSRSQIVKRDGAPGRCTSAPALPCD